MYGHYSAEAPVALAVYVRPAVGAHGRVGPAGCWVEAGGVNREPRERKGKWQAT